VVAPEKPPDEADRLAALHALQLLDTPRDERFDRITRTATRLFDVPIAMLTLVDEDRQWFKSCVGQQVTETPRDISFCGHAILRPAPFIIPDAILDKRFKENPQVVGYPHVRFYAGIPIHSFSGHTVGTFCIIDTKPREPSDEDLDGLVDLAGWAETEIHLVEFSRALRGQPGFEALGDEPG
jgi:GAF domain-containing protein